MAEGLPTPKSREQILSEMLTEYVGLTGINDLNTGSVITQFFDVVARSVARTSGDIFQILRDFSLDRATGEALDRLGQEERIPRITSKVATGIVTVIDTNFEKIETKIYSGSSAPNIGSTTIRVSDASAFPSSGRVYIGRGTPNIEGPINYNSVTQVGSFYEITLDSPTNKFHNISESVIVGQGGTRNIPAGITVISPGIGATPDIAYAVSSVALILDGENTNTNVQVSAQEPGTLSNAPVGAIREFVSEPFIGAAVINESPFTTGADSESDNDYRDRIKKARFSRGLGTALAIRNAVLGAQSLEENERITSTDIDDSDSDQTTLYIDNGRGYEEKVEGVGKEVLIESAIGGEQNFQLDTNGQQTSVAKAFLESSQSAPFSLVSFDTLSVLVGGVISEHTFLEGSFKAEGAATAYEIVSSINNNSDLTFEATTSENGTKVILKAKAELNEFLQITTPTSGEDAAAKMGFQTNEVSTVLLYKNGELLNRNGRSAFVISKDRSDWSSLIADGDTLIISVDNTEAITYTFENDDFIEEGQHLSVSNTNSLSSWVNVINTKVTGVTAEVNGNQIKLTSNLDSSDRAAISIDPTSTLVIKGMFSSELGLSAEGNESDFQISRNTAQIKLNTPLSKGDSLTLGSEFTRAEIKSSEILGGTITIPDTAYLWMSVDDKDAQVISTGVISDTFITVTKPGSGIVRYESSSADAFANVQVGDYVIIWSEELSAGNRLEGRVNAVTSTTLDLKVTTAEESSAVAESLILFSQGFTVIRSDYVPQKIKLNAGLFTLSEIATLVNGQITNAVMTVDNDEHLIIRTNTEDLDGALFIADFNDAAVILGFTRGTKEENINSQFAFYETEFKDRQWPEFVHGKITSDAFADTPDSYITSIDSNEDLSLLDIDPSGFICFSQPYGSVSDVSSTECVEIENLSGTTITVEESNFYRRSRVDDRYHVLSGYDFGHEDSIVAILNNDPTGSTFEIPLYRTAVTNITHPSNPNNFRAYDLEGGGTTEFTEFFGNEFPFDNYKALMRAKNAIDPLSLATEDAVFYRSAEWGASGEKFGIGYFYPTSASQPITHTISVGKTVDVKLYLKSGASIVTTVDGTTEWDVTITPLNPSVDLVTYAHSGTGTAPGLGSLNSGDYVSILSTGEFLPENQGGYRIESANASSFTIRRPTGAATAQTDVATIQTSTISFFESSNTTAQEIVTYVNDNLSDYFSAEILDDTGTTGVGVIDKSTGEDSDFSYELVYMKDGKNFILSSDLDALVGSPQFTFKNALDLPAFSTTTTDAYSFNNAEPIRLVPITSLQLTEFLNILAVTGFTTLGTVKSTERNTKVQFMTDILGSNGAIQIAGGSGSSSVGLVEGSASTIGDQSDLFSIVTIPSSSAFGFHSDQWVKVSASEKQKKNTGINDANSISISKNTPSIGSSKIEIFNKDIGQRIFGRNRYHTRTRGRTFKVEKQGELTCLSWDDNGIEPFFLKTGIDVKDVSASTLTLFKNDTFGTIDISVDTGDMRFDEISLGDLINLSNRLNDSNNGSFLVVGKTEDGKTLRISNPNGVSELAIGSFTITDNVAVVGSSFTVGSNTFVEGVDFSAGATINDTASNLAAVIDAITEISATSDGANVNIESEVPGVTVALSVSGGGATASGSQLTAPISNTGDLTAQSEVQEGDSLSISSNFNVLNQGIFRVIRKFKNSIYIDNPNSIEEEVLLSDQIVSLGSNASTDYDVEKLDGIVRLKWAGAGDEPSLEDLRPGDIANLGTDFSASNQGDFHVVNSGEKLQEITKFTQSRGIDMASGQYGLLYSTADAIEYYFWYNIDAAGGDPAPVGKTAIEIAIASTDSAAQVAQKKADVINTTFSSDFSAEVDGDDVIITTVGYGPTTDASNVDIAGDFSIEVKQQGRRNFVDFINVNGVSESGITIADVLEFHREAMKFKEYEGSIPGDSMVFTDNFLGDSNTGSFVIQEILSDSEIIVSGNMEDVEETLLDSDASKVYIEESEAYVGYKKIYLISTNPLNANTKNIVFDTANQFAKINEIAGVSVSSIAKLSLPTELNSGIDAYKFNTGLIAEANRIVYGDPRDNTTYPGVGAAGAEIFIEAPIVRRIEVSIDVRIKTGVPFSVITEEVRNSVAALINSNDIGSPIAISDIVSEVNAIIGVQAVAISSPQYDSENDVIRVNSGEKALILDIVSDIIVSKID